MIEIKVTTPVAVIAIYTMSQLFLMGRSYFQSIKHHSYSHRKGRKIFSEIKSRIIKKMDLSFFHDESGDVLKLQDRRTSHLSICKGFTFFPPHCFYFTFFSNT